MGDSQEELGRLYLAEKLGQKVLKKHFALDAGLDCYYPNNYTHAEMRGGAPFMRPTFASKHVLKSAVESGAFHDDKLTYGYHGTPACNLASILKQGLKPSKCGALGDGLYFSPSPLYAQLYSTSAYHCGPGSPIETWSHGGVTYFVDVMFMLRISDKLQYNSGLEETAATIGAEYCIHNLFQGASMEIANKLVAKVETKDCPGVTLQAVIVKLHTHHPYDSKNGEWSLVKDLVRRKNKQAEASAA